MASRKENTTGCGFEHLKFEGMFLKEKYLKRHDLGRVPGQTLLNATHHTKDVVKEDQSFNSESDLRKCGSNSTKGRAHVSKHFAIMGCTISDPTSQVLSLLSLLNVAFPALELFGFPISPVIQSPILLTSSRSIPVFAPRECRV